MKIHIRVARKHEKVPTKFISCTSYFLQYEINKCAFRITQTVIFNGNILVNMM